MVNNPTNTINYDELWDHAKSIFLCDLDSIHGPNHWKRVEKNGIPIGEQIGADLTVVRLFAIYHDSCRLNDGHDGEHGPRAADMLLTEHKNLFNIQKDQLIKLLYAIRHHTLGQISQDVTIGTCWDADRLELGRVGISPSPEFMSTGIGKEMAPYR